MYMVGLIFLEPGTGKVEIKGRWALRQSDIDDKEFTSPFEYHLTSPARGALPESGVYAGGFDMKMPWGRRKVCEDGLNLVFRPNGGGEGESFDLSASGSNEFGVFTMTGSASPEGPGSFRVEIFRTYIAGEHLLLMFQ